MQYIYPPDIFDHSPERLLKVLSSDFRRRRLEKGMSRKHLSDLSGSVPEIDLVHGKQNILGIVRALLHFHGILR